MVGVNESCLVDFWEHLGLFFRSDDATNHCNAHDVVLVPTNDRIVHTKVLDFLLQGSLEEALVLSTLASLVIDAS